MSEVRVRFPPSPTGYLHIGGARTAIYNWLFAKKHGGKMILRIEDTDAERSTTESIDGIINGLTWLGVTWDEGPYFQSDHAAEHRAAANRLVAEGHAYKCFCTKEELDAKREVAIAAKTTYMYDRTCCRLTSDEITAREQAGTPYVIRIKIPDRQGALSFTDQVYGRIDRPYHDIEDFVIVRSNGMPLYLLSNVVDDIRDRITHVIRGQDGLVNTPKQILLYEALGAQVPVFAHMSLTLDPKKAKISKRSHGEVVTVQFYREHGFIPWALVNFLVLLGWAPGDDREILTPEELIAAFSLEGLSKANAVFNYNKDDLKFFTDPKAINLNAHYLRTMPVEELAALVKPELQTAGLWTAAYEDDRRAWFLTTLALIRDRFHTLLDFAVLGRAYFADDYPVDPTAIQKNIAKHEKIAEWLGLLASRFADLAEFTKETTEQATRELAAELEIKPGLLINGTRTVVTGQVAGPGLFDILVTIGRDRVVDRLRRTAEIVGR
ncbi:MAG: glutamate--tRNA ligase [Deltaproteobacteria bacterium RIFOXYD12_FULL_57_12]|nr:MAG: glutamate--tRNA ligase [Deltaproteobacteria bacterium RIFOXYD12_FULL_57_12]